MNPILMFTLFVVLLALTAFFNLAEMALVAARASKLESADNAKAAEKVRTLKSRPGLFLAAIRAGDLVADLLTGAFVVTWLEHLIRSGPHGLPLVGAYASTIAGLAAFVVVSYAVLVLGDLAPKSIALNAPERAAMLIASPLRLLIVVARPFFTLLETSNCFVLRLFGVKPHSEERLTEEEIRRTLSQGLSAGVLLSFERSMMERVLDLDHRSVRTVMTGRRGIEFLQADSDSAELRTAVLEATASLLLVTDRNNLDQVIGIVSRAHVLAAIARGETIDLQKMMAPPAYVTEYASVLSVLETLKSTAFHIVIVVDEFGSLMGLVTLADVLEAVAGDVTTDDGAVGTAEERPLESEADGSYLVPGDQPVDDIVEVLHFQAPARRNYKTMAGFIIDRLRRIPQEGEIFDLPTIRIEVVSVEGGAIKDLRLVPRQNKEPLGDSRRPGENR